MLQSLEFAVTDALHCQSVCLGEASLDKKEMIIARTKSDG